ncbi:phosphatidylserine decarboxylase family protein [uncultured Bacteroides sp.]|jgi:phosphatidylserine decarboxylase|uniref:phosphatidylserine decarboxylase family protein n=1 Tax=uncultured Bacteroides sp. TaxID=162156 RepID=UPI0026183FF1|nr:phosphatidylserine decarboxylase family protein [uncultured Bacteroides sp.]
MNRLKKIKKIRLHREGTHTLIWGFLLLLAINLPLYFAVECKIPFYVVAVISLVVYGIMVNFFRCPIRLFGKDTEKVVVAPADGKIVVVEEVEENEYFHDRRIMVSIFMSLVNVHANWYPVDGTVKSVSHQNGKFMKAWLPKASTDNERSTVVIETPEGVEIMARQIAGAMARRIVTYAEPGEECYIDEHMGFIKFGSRVDVFLPLGTEVLVKLGQLTTGNQTVIAKLK